MRGRGGRKRPADDGWAEKGGYMNAKIQKLADQNLADSLESQIFNGITIYVNGYTKPSSENLKQMVTTNGGVYSHYYSKTKVTHIIASNLPTSKINELKNEKVCSPQWIVESLQEGKLLPYHKYLLYTPKNLQQNDILTSFKTLSTTSLDTKTTHTLSGDNITTNTLPRDNITTNTLPRDNSTTNTLPRDNSTSSNDEIIFTESEPSKETCEYQTKSENYVSEFYNRSRLHHISMWGAESKSYVALLQKQIFDDKSPQTFKGLEKFAEEIQSSLEKYSLAKGQKIFAHIDIDCFFVSVGLLKRPELIGQPIAVTHSKGRDPHSSTTGETGGLNSRSDIASCSYEARKMGVSNGMHFGDAKKICPDLVAIPYDFEDYKKVSQRFYDTVLSFTTEVEAVSCDELYFDCTDLVLQTGASPLRLAESLRREVFEATGCNCSCGLGSNMLIARLSTNKAKPNGQHYVGPGHENDFMKEIKVSDLPGIGRVMNNKLTSMGITNCEKLSKVSISKLQETFGGKVGSRLFKQARGQDDRALSVGLERKSVSAEINYGIRFTQKSEVENFIRDLSKEVQNRLQQLNKKGKHLTLKVKVRQEGAPVETYKFLGHGLCDNISKSHMLPMVTDSSDIIGQECCNLMNLLKVPVEDLRGIGIQVTSLENTSGQSTITTTCNTILKYATKSKNKDRLQDEISENKQSIIHPINNPAIVYDEVKQSTNNGDDKFFISLSQIDMNTLEELPEDIQREFKDALERRNQGIRTTRFEDENPQRIVGPGCSHWNDIPDDDVVVERSVEEGNKKKNEAPLRGLEGLDDSFLRAMPEDIRLELLNARKQLTTLNNNNPTRIQLQQPLASKSKRGGKKVVSKNSTKTTALKQNAGRQQTLKAIVIPKPSKEVNNENINNSTNIRENINKPTNIHENIASEEINLKGLIDVDDVKQLIRQWTSLPVPQQDDLDSLVEFLLKLVQESNIDKVFIILRGIQRIQDVTPQWKEEIRNVFATVQAAVKAIYGGKLKMLTL